MTASTIAPAALRDALAEAAEAAAKHRAQTDMELARALAGMTVALEMACCDETAVAMVRAAPARYRDEIAGATTDEDVISAVTGGTGGEEK